MKYLYRFYEDCGRMGSLDGIFVAEESDVDALIGQNLYFGEVLGKHSDIDVDFTKDSFEKMDVSQSAIDEVSKVLGNSWSGWNPVEMWEHRND